jgi:hypothetical protein
MCDFVIGFRWEKIFKYICGGKALVDMRAELRKTELSRIRSI